MKKLFNVYIDESGDEGFTIKNGKWVSSEWFIVGALIVRNSNDLYLSKCINTIKNTLNYSVDKPLHFAEVRSDKRRRFIIYTIKQTGYFRCCYVAVNKKKITKAHLKNEKDALYNYSIRYLIERISWLVDDYNGIADLIFENRSNTSYEELNDYINYLIRYDNNQIRPNTIRSYKPLNKSQSKNLQVADSITSALYKALELDSFGMPDPTYIRELKKFIYNKNGNYASYGLKFFPKPCNDKEYINKYGWIEDFI